MMVSAEEGQVVKPREMTAGDPHELNTGELLRMDEFGVSLRVAVATARRHGDAFVA